MQAYEISSNEDAKALVTMPRVVWEGIGLSAGQSGRDPIDEIVFRLAESLDVDIVIETKLKAIPKDISNDSK